MRTVRVQRVKAGLTALFGAASLFVTLGAQAAGDAAKGQAAASKCISCHGSKGQGSPGTPALAGKTEGDLAAALEAYKSGARTHMMMNTVAKGLGAEDIANLAAYFASLK